jgi:hypothetical protein
MTPEAILLGAAERLSKPGAWTQGAYGRDRNGHRVSCVSSRAIQWCALGAMLKETGTLTPGRPYRAAVEALERVLNSPAGSTFWNDEPTRTQGEVVSALRAAAVPPPAQG